MDIHFLNGAFDGSFWLLNMKELRWKGDMERAVLWSLKAWLHASVGIKQLQILVIHAYHKVPITSPYPIRSAPSFSVVKIKWLHVHLTHIFTCQVKTIQNMIYSSLLCPYKWYLTTVSKPFWNNEIFLLWLDQTPSGGCAFVPHTCLWHYSVHEVAFMNMHQNLQQSCSQCKAFISSHAVGANAFHTYSHTVTKLI